MIRLAIPAEGLLNRESLQFLNRIGIKLPCATQACAMYATNFPLEIIAVTETDILSLVQSGMMDIGLVSEHHQEEKNADVQVLRHLGIATHNMAIGGTPNIKYKSLETLNGKTILTPFPNFVNKELKAKNIKAKVQGISDALKSIPPGDMSEFYCDAIPAGLHFQQKGLKELELLATFETLLVVHSQLATNKKTILEELVFRMDATAESANKQTLTMRVPTKHIEDILTVLPSQLPPMVMPINNELSLVQTLVDDTRFWDIVTKLKQLGATEITLAPINHLIH